MDLQALYLAAALLTNSTPEDMECLAKTVYFESRGEPVFGQVLVSVVVSERSSSSRYPTSLCDVVQEQRRPGRYMCQFTWYCDGKSDTPKDEKLYLQSIALGVIGMWVAPLFPHLTHYHSTKVNPDWSGWDKLDRAGLIGTHYFYEEKED